MADFFVIAELVKYYELTTPMMIHNSFTYKTKITTPSVLDCYFTTLYGAEDLTNKQSVNILGVYVDYDQIYSRQTSIVDCEDNEESFYFDITNQMLYIHFNHSISPSDSVIEYGKVFGFTNDQVRNFNGIDYLPLIKSIPKFKIKVDPLRYTQQSFYGGNIIFSNLPVDGSDDGTFDSNEEFTGNDIRLLFGADGDAYTDLLIIATVYVENTIISMDEIIVKTKDKREQQSATFPTEVFDDTTFPDIDPDLVSEIMPDAYGHLYGVPGICVNSEQAVDDKIFYFASIITAAPAPVFKCKQDEKWTVIVPTATDYPNGMASFADADVHVDGDVTKGLEDVRCDGYFRPFYNPADIISDLNLRVLDIVFNASNYDTVEWNSEKSYLADDLGLYMDEEKELFEWIELLQNGSTVGFQYFFDQGLRTIRLDNPNRTAVRTIYAQEIINDPKFENNEDFFATHAKVKYRQDHSDDRWKRITNMDYYFYVFMKHRQSKINKVECLLFTQADAEDKAIIIMEDLQEERPTGPLLLWGKDYHELRLFDIINAEISKPGIKTGEETVDLYIEEDAGADTYVEEDGTLSVYVDVDYTKRDIIINYREFLGWMRFQIIGLQPEFDGNIEIEVRQRDFSDEFASITGYP